MIYNLLTSLVFILCLVTTFHSFTTKSIAEFVGNREQNNETIEIFYSEGHLLDKILYHEQNRLISLLLKKYDDHSVINETMLPRNLASKVIEAQLPIDELVIALLKPLGEYGSEKGEEITNDQKMSIFHNWLRRSILGMTFLDWFLNEVRIIKFEKNDSYLTHRHFEKIFLKLLHTNSDLGELSTKAKIYYQQNLLKDDMPSFLLMTTNSSELKRLQTMNLTEPDFGYLYVGLIVMRESRLEFDKHLNLDEVIDIGFFIETLIRDGKSEFIYLFELPAKIYYLSSFHDNIPLPKNIWGLHYDEYFEHLEKSNPVYQMMAPLSNWKDRPSLAKQLMKAHDIPENIFLNNYLSAGTGGYYRNRIGELVNLPNIDQIFDEQNNNISNFVQKIDKLLLVQVLNNMNKEDYEYMRLAEIERVQVEILDCRRPYYRKCKLQVPAFNVPYIYHKRDSIVLEANNVDLLYCAVNNHKRIYALINTGNYELRRIDTSIMKYMRLFNRTDLMNTISEYTFNIIAKESLKTMEEIAFEGMIKKLSEYHKIKLYNLLKAVGYKETLMQKVKNFLLSLIPFYTCHKEMKNENYGAAAFSCILDIVTLIPALGLGFKVAHQWSSVLGEMSTLALKQVERKASMYQILHRTGKNLFFHGFSQLQKPSNLRIYSNIALEFVHIIDPGIELLKLGGVQGIKAIRKTSNFLKDRFFKLDKIAEKLVIRAEKELSQANLISAEVLETKRVVFLPDISQEATVVKIESKNDKDVLVRIDSETNIPFGIKYQVDPKTNFIEVSPISINDKIYQLKIHRPLTRKDTIPLNWVNWKDQTISLKSTKVSEVFRADTRHPDEIEIAGGCWPFEGRYDYNLETTHLSYQNNYDNVVANPFVSTTSSFSIAVKHLGFLRSMDYLMNKKPINKNIIGYIYKVRPDSNFYNLRESYIAARDVCHPNSERYKRIDELIKKWGTMNEYVAKGGFEKDRIIEYAAVKKFIGGSTYVQWVINRSYNPKFNKDLSASDVYARVAMYKSDDATDMAINIVQQIRKINKEEAEKLIKCTLNENQVMELVTKFDTNKEGYIKLIKKLTCSL